MSGHIHLFSGIDPATGRVVSISEIDSESNGLRCGCVCPVCKGSLVAKMNHRTPHFAHHAGARAECEWAHESILHLKAKQLLEETKRMAFPKLDVYVKTPWIASTIAVSKSSVFDLDRVEIEQPKEGFKPDLCVYIHEVPCYVEIRVTHPVPPEKLEKVVAQGVSMLEIDLGDVPRNISDAELTRILLSEPERMTWLYNRKAALIEKRETESIKSRRAAATSITLDGRYDQSHHTQWIKCPLDSARLSPFTPFCIMTDRNGHYFPDSERCEHFLGFLGRRPDASETTDWFKGKFLCDAKLDADCGCSRHRSHRIDPEG